MSRSISIGSRVVGDGHPCFVIAEVGVNHNGDSAIAHKMVDAIADAGADCVKFQTFTAQEFCNSADETYEYVSQGKVVRESMLEMFQRLELKREEFAKLFEHARRRGMIALSTPTDRAAADLLEGLGAEAYKIGSDDLVYPQLIDYVARKGRPMILSTGMAEPDDVERGVRTVEAAGGSLAVLHCVSLYPTPVEQVNLRRITALRAQYDTVPVGFSDHSFGVTAALGAVALGACIVEKHFTLDRDMPGPDHRFSADPAELTRLVAEIRGLEAMLGSPRPRLSAAEQEMAALAHRSIVAATDLPAGTVLAEGHFAFRRPGTGLAPHHAPSLLGRRLRRDVAAGALLSPVVLDE